MLYKGRNIDLFSDYIDKHQLLIPFKTYTGGLYTGTFHIDLYSQKRLFKPSKLYDDIDKGFFVFGNLNLSSNIIICNDIGYFIKSFKNQIDLEYTSIVFTHKSILAINYLQLGSFLHLNKTIYTFYKDPFDRFLLDAFLHKGLKLDSEGNFIYNNKVISPSFYKTKINKTSHLRTVIKHIT